MQRSQKKQITWAPRLTGNPTLLSVLILPWPNKKLDCFKTFFFFLKFCVSRGDIWKSGLTISGSGACDGAEGSATAAQQSADLRNHYCRCSYRKKKRRSIRVERPELLPTTDATDVYHLMRTVSWSSALNTRKWPPSYVRPCAVNVHRFLFTDVAKKPRIGIGRLCPDYRKLNTALGSSCAERPVGQV